MKNPFNITTTSTFIFLFPSLPIKTTFPPEDKCEASKKYLKCKEAKRKKKNHAFFYELLIIMTKIYTRKIVKIIEKNSAEKINYHHHDSAAATATLWEKASNSFA